MQRQQGVLWKRRDVFKNRWRPRWFVLHSSQGVLTYYILTTPPSEPFSSPLSHANSAPQTEPLRARASSWDSAVSEHSVDYDVVPRGTIDLLGCTVTINDEQSKPQENFYAFTIRSPASIDTDVHLAARSSQSRELWVQRIARVCNGGITPDTVMPRLVPSSRIPPVVHEEQQLTVNGSMSSEATVPSSGDRSHGDSDGWRTLGSESSCFENVPDELAARLRDTLQTYLTVCDQDPDRPESGWKKLFARQVGNNPHKAYKRQEPDGRTITRSTAVLNHPPQQVFNLLIDSSRRHTFETNVRYDERMKVLNSHTFLDYYAYNAVWPSSAREFTVALHWQVVAKPNNDERAIALVSLSCAQAETLKTVAPNHVRGILHVSMYLLRDMSSQHQCCCHLTRFLSFDLGGGMSRKLSNVVLTQQASLPGVISDFLQRHEPVPENRFLSSSPLTSQAVVENVIDRLGSTKSSLRRQLTFTECESFVQEDEKVTDVKNPKPNLETQAVLLLAPLVLYRALVFLTLIPGLALVVFCATAFAAVRQLVLLHIGEVLPKSETPPLVGPVSCRFTVELKGVLRFIANKKEERDDLQQDHEEVSLVHLVTCAVAKAWANEKELRVRRASYPLLMIDELVDVSSAPVNVSVSENASGVVTLERVNRRSVQSVANELSRAEHHHDSAKTLGECLILATPGVEENLMETDAMALSPNVAVVAVVGGVRMQNSANRRNWLPQRPMLSVSLTLSVPHLTDVVGCRRFAEEVQKLLQFPEMCDG